MNSAGRQLERGCLPFSLQIKKGDKMKQVIEPNEKVIAFIKTNKPETEGLRPARWTVAFSERGINLMKNIFSGEVVQLTDEEYNKPESVQELAKRRFVVPEGYNEADKYLETSKLIKLMKNEKKGLVTYTILPTTGCNARCTYCYEEGYAVRTMTPETVERLIDFICETRSDEKITLSWFGGEPLVCAKTISHVCKTLSERGESFRSRMITNASLMTKELAHEAKEVWKLKTVQVSLDGDRRDYMARKQYIDPVRHNYDVVMRSIHYLADEDIKVSLRVNFDKESFPRLRPFLDEIKSEFGDDKNVTLYLSALYQEKPKPYFIDLERQMFELNRYIDELNINNIEREKRTTGFRLNSCMADCLDKAVVIDPDGCFYDCEHLPEGHSWGNIFEGVTDQALFDELRAIPGRLDEKCRNCTYLPQCTPFYKQGCPGWFEACFEYQQLKTEYELRKIAEKIIQQEQKND